MQKTKTSIHHSFDIIDAELFGVKEAILIQHIKYWLRTNIANNTNFHEGRHWTYNSTEAFSMLFPYLKRRTISDILNRLVQEGVLLKGIFNENSFDRTLWYTISDKYYENYSEFIKTVNGLEETANVIGENRQSTLAKTANVYTNINTDINTDVVESPVATEVSLTELLPIEKCCMLYEQSKQFAEARYNFCFSHKLMTDGKPDTEKLQHALDEFYRWQKGSGVNHKTMRDFPGHFYSWMSKRPKEIKDIPIGAQIQSKKEDYFAQFQ